MSTFVTVIFSVCSHVKETHAFGSCVCLHWQYQFLHAIWKANTFGINFAGVCYWKNCRGHVCYMGSLTAFVVVAVVDIIQIFVKHKQLSLLSFQWMKDFSTLLPSSSFHQQDCVVKCPKRSAGGWLCSENSLARKPCTTIWALSYRQVNEGGSYSSRDQQGCPLFEGHKCSSV